MAGNGFNAFEFAAELKKAGVPAAQADLQARAMAQLQDSTAATKQDLEITKLELKRDIAELNASLNASLTWKMIVGAGFIVAFLGGLITFLKFFS